MDVFVAFVDALAEHLDDHGARGDDLAARAFLSRFHFDRVVSALSGETPARFRRRILLERAAYRLRTTDRRLLDIGVEAGYSSNEAFGRAFRRAYGVLPSLWRPGTGQFQIDCPNGVHFHPPGGLRLPARAEVSPMTMIVEMVRHHVSVVGQMIDRAAQLTDDELDRPIELSVEGIDRDPTLRSLLTGLVSQIERWNAAVDNREYDEVDPGESPAAMRGRLGPAGETFVRQVVEVTEQNRLDETFVDASSGRPYVFTYAGMIAHVLTYAAHRRTLAAGALASAGVDVDDDPLSWFAAPAETRPDS